MKQEARQLIRKLKANKPITDLNTYIDTKDDYFSYYANLTGWYNNEYFSIFLFCHLEKWSFIIESTTENPNELLKYLSKLSNLKFELR